MRNYDEFVSFLLVCINLNNVQIILCTASLDHKNIIIKNKDDKKMPCPLCESKKKFQEILVNRRIFEKKTITIFFVMSAFF